MPPENSRLSIGRRLLVLLGAVVLAAMGLLVAASPVIAPPWGVVVLWSAWIAAVVWAIRGARSNSYVPLIAAAAMVGFWFAFLTFGDLILGWSA